MFPKEKFYKCPIVREGKGTSTKSFCHAYVVIICKTDSLR